MNTLTPIVEEQKTLPPIEEEGNPVLTGEALFETAKRYSLALEGDFSKQEEFAGLMNSGLESALREQAAFKEESKQLQLHTELVRGLAGMKEKTPQEEAILQDILTETANLKPQDRETILERKFGGALTAYGVSLFGTEETQEELSRPDGAGFDKLSYLTSHITLMEGARKLAEELKAGRQDKGYSSTAYETLVQMVPFLETINLNLASDEDGVSFFTGEAQKEISDMLLWMDDGEAALKKLREIVGNVAGLSEWQAIALAEYVGGGSWSDRVLGNTFTAIDMATAGSGALAKGATKSVASLAKGVVVTAAQKNATTGKILGNFGKNREAARETAQKILPLVTSNTNKIDRQVAEGLMKNLPMTFRPKGTFYDDYSGDYQSQVAQMIQSAQLQGKQMMTPLFEKVRASRHSGGEAEELLRVNEALLKREGTITAEQAFGEAYGAPIFQLPQPYAVGARYEPSFKVTDVIRPEDTLTDSGYLKVEYGSPVTGNGFTSELEAKRWAVEIMHFAPTDFEIRPVGGSYFVDRVTPLVELSDGSLAATLKDDAMLADSLPSLIISRLQSSDTFLSKHDLGTTKVAMHLPQKVKASLETTVDAFKAARDNKKQFEEFAGFLHHQTTQKRTLTNPVTGEDMQVLGKWSENANEFTKDFLQYTASRGAKRPPTAKEMQAYVAFRQLQEVDWAFRATRILQQQNAKGIKSIQLDTIMTQSGPGQIAPFKGRVVTKLPQATDKEFAVAHIERGGLKDIYTNVDQTGKGAGNYQTSMAEIQRLIDEEGYKLVELAQPDNYPLMSFLRRKEGMDLTDERVDYVLVKKFSARNLQLNEADTLRRAEGGHHVYDTVEYVGQDQVQATKSGRNYLRGFKPAFGQKREGLRMTDEVLRDMNAIRELVKKGDEAAALKYAQTSKIPYDPVQFVKNFQKRVVDGADEPPVWDVNVPFRKARHGTTIEQPEIDALRKVYPNLRASDNLRNNLWESIDKKFIGQRADELLDTVVEKQGRYTTMPAPMRSPIDVINSSAHNMVRAIGFDNVKTSTVNKWIAKYGKYLDAPLEDVKNNPVWYFHNGTLRSGDTKITKMAAIDKRAVENILGTPSEIQTTLDVYRSKLSTMVEETLGRDFADSFDEMALMKTRDPFKFARGFAFHTKIGLFNPIQAVLQAQSVAHAMMITGDPKRSFSSLAGMTASRMLMKNPKQVDFAKSVARKMGYNPDDFIEAHEWMLKYGINRIEGEHALLDDLLETNLFKGKTGAFIDKGAMFFREGELVPRMTSWHIAWQEWRKANPGKKVTRLDLESIAARQDNLSNNMTRKSSADIQHGWTSTATQFWGWQMRLMESILGKKLTPAERGRLFLGYGAMYGIPGATAAAVGLPTAVVGGITGQLGIDLGPLGSTDHYADIKKYALENGIDVDTGALEWMMEGITSKAIEGITGKDTNWAQRMGPGGLFLWENLAKNEAGIMDLLGGASLGIGLDAWRNMSPLTDSIIRMAGLNQEFNAKRTMEETIQALGVVSSVNNIRLGWDILRYQEYRFKSGTLATDNLDIVDAALAALVGLSPQEIPDAFLKQEVMTEGKGSSTKVEDTVAGYLKDHRRMAAQAIKHATRGDLVTAKNYEDSASVIADMINTLYPDHAWKIGGAFTEESMVEQIGRRFENYTEQKKALEEGN